MATNGIKLVAIDFTHDLEPGTFYAFVEAILERKRNAKYVSLINKIDISLHNHTKQFFKLSVDI